MNVIKSSKFSCRILCLLGLVSESAMTRPWLILSIVLFATVPQISCAESISAKDFDLACSIATAAEVGSAPANGTVRETALKAHIFYLGRLSARDDKTMWHTVVSGRIAELREKARSPDLFGSCLNFAAQKISE